MTTDTQEKAPDRSEVMRLYQSAAMIHDANRSAFAGACLTGSAELIERYRRESLESLDVLMDAQERFLRAHWSF